MKKRMLAVLLASVTACSLGGCAGEKKDTVRTVKIGLTLYDQYDTFISELVSWFNASASALEEETGTAINVEVVDAAGSQTTQNEQVKSLIEKGCDVICVNLVDRTEPTTITDMAEKNDVPIIFFNRELVAEDLERWEKLYYVGADAFGSGIIEGELAAETFQSDPKYDKNGDDICQYVVLEGEAGHQDAIVRTEYSVNTLVEKGVKAEKLGYAIANWKRAQAQTKMTTLLEQYGERIELILANNDDMALAAARTAKSNPNYAKTIFLGFDGQKSACEAVAAGELTMTAAQNNFDIGYKAVETIVKILNGEEYGDVDTGTEIITKDNAQARLDNFANWLK